MKKLFAVMLPEGLIRMVKREKAETDKFLSEIVEEALKDYFLKRKRL